MSYCGAFPVDVDPSDSSILIDACLARVRREAGLDDDPVLPPLHELLAEEPREPLSAPAREPRSSPSPWRRVVVGPSAHNLPSAEDIVRAAAKPSEPPKPVDVTSSAAERKEDATESAVAAKSSALATHRSRRRRSIVQRMRWPVLLCGFLAGVFGGAALMKSPVGQKPAVQRAVKAVRYHAVNAYVATAAATQRIAQ